MHHLLDDVEFGRDFEGVRDKLVISLFYGTGVRLSELLNLKDVDVNQSGKYDQGFGKKK